MALAQHLFDDDFTPTDYFMYYRRRCSLNNYQVILDNGVYEGCKLGGDYLLRATLELNPHIVILPDVIDNMTSTLQVGEVFKERLRANKWKGRTMTVLQAEPNNLNQWCHAYMEATKQSEWVGFPRNGKYGVASRAAFARELQNRNLWDARHRHHALGMVDGSYEELTEVATCGFFDSCDSSAPIWRAFDTYNHCDPNFVDMSLRVGHAKHNFDHALEICRGDVWKSTSAPR
jgi:hypothetical protein